MKTEKKRRRIEKMKEIIKYKKAEKTTKLKKKEGNLVLICTVKLLNILLFAYIEIEITSSLLVVKDKKKIIHLSNN